MEKESKKISQKTVVETGVQVREALEPAAAGSVRKTDHFSTKGPRGHEGLDHKADGHRNQGENFKPGTEARVSNEGHGKGENGARASSEGSGPAVVRTVFIPTWTVSSDVLASIRGTRTSFPGTTAVGKGSVLGGGGTMRASKKKPNAGTSSTELFDGGRSRTQAFAFRKELGSFWGKFILKSTSQFLIDQPRWEMPTSYFRKSKYSFNC